MILAIIQARMSSSRLPGKVLLDIAGKPMLSWVVERAGMAETVDRVVVATTTGPADDPIVAFCRAQGYTFTRGSQLDVLDRFVQAARQHKADIVVRITADCPLLDPGLVDETVKALLDSTQPLDFAANRLPPPWGRSYPIGLDVEVVTRATLERAWSETTEKHHREHVLPYLYDDLPADALTPQTSHIARRTPHVTHALSPRGFRVALLHHLPDYSRIRWTVDTSEDLEAVRRLAALLPALFTWNDALGIWQAHPEIARINAQVMHKTSSDIDDRA